MIVSRSPSLPDAVPADYLAALRATGAVRTAALEHAFAAVPRHRCVPGFFTHPGEQGAGTYVEVPQHGPVPPDLLAAVYADHPLVTHLDPDGAPTSSSSTPSVMAHMLQALRLGPGMTVLEIGSGTGYNAALMSVLTAPHGRVVSLDTQPEVVAGAAASLSRVGRTGVSVQHADGWGGHPAEAPYDRIIATVGVAGLSPHWLGQLAPDGVVVVPVAHGGAHPVIAVERDRQGEPIGRPVVWTGFIRAGGRLADAGRPPSWPGPQTMTSAGVHTGLVPQLDDDGYRDLWFSLACLDRRVIRASSGSGSGDGFGLADPRLGLLYVARDAVRRTGHPRLVDELRSLVDRWQHLGRPGPERWSCRLVPAGSVLVPSDWRCAA
jgi:protein-L-isoaspartate(D-aspartate) O-methyltransferase